MTNVFSDYVRQLAAGREPDRADFDEVREHLRAHLVTEMRKRGLWTASPAYLGVIAPSWQEPGALDELVDEAFDFVLIDRLMGLIRQLQVNPAIDGLVVWNLRHFLTERQRRADPLGYRVFSRLKAAVDRLIGLGRLFLLGLTGGRAPRGGSPLDGVVNSSVLALTQKAAAVADRPVLESSARQWNDRLMPDLALAEGRSVPAVVERLANQVADLPAVGVSAFRFGDLAKALKDDARKRWQAVWDRDRQMAPEDGEPGAPQVPIAQPDVDAFDETRFRDAVLACVEVGIAASGRPKLERELWSLWIWLRSSRIDADEPQELPNHLELGSLLGLNRERVAQLLDQLKQLVRGCLETAGLRGDRR